MEIDVLERLLTDRDGVQREVERQSGGPATRRGRASGASLWLGRSDRSWPHISVQCGWRMATKLGDHAHKGAGLRGPRTLVEDDSVRSAATTLLNLEAGYQLHRNVRVSLRVFKLANARSATSTTISRRDCQASLRPASEIFHRHPSAPRTARIGVAVGFCAPAIPGIGQPMPSCTATPT